MPLTYRQAREAAERGAEMLDSLTEDGDFVSANGIRIGHDWRVWIDTDTLDMADGTRCVLAQTTRKPYSLAILALFESRNIAEEARYGLFCPSNHVTTDDCDMLTVAWVDLLAGH